MQIGVVKESQDRRVAIAPAIVKKFTQMGLKVAIEKGAGLAAGYPDSAFASVGAGCLDRSTILKSPIVASVQRIPEFEISSLAPNSLYVGLLEPYRTDSYFEKLKQQQVHALSLERIPRISRAQSMDVLSSQANLAGYRAVLEAANQYGRLFPMMMTSAGLAKAAKVCVLGVGVAGLQAIATAKRLGASVEAFDVRSEVKEQVQSLGAKFLDLGLSEEGSGTGGYAKELSKEGQQRQQAALTEKLKGFDIVITTANVPGRKAPVLVLKEAVYGMRPGSVIVDMATPSGGNCELSKLNEIVEVEGVKIVGFSNYAELVAADASQFFAGNLAALLALFLKKSENGVVLHFDETDEIVTQSLVTQAVVKPIVVKPTVAKQT